MRYFLYLSYMGTAYHGWQYQPNGISVQEVLQGALSTLLRESTEVLGAGRTDSGVHAALMVAHFDTESTVPTSDDFLRRLNSILPRDIAVHQLRPVKADAHARFDAVARRYEYHVHFGKNVFKQHLSLRLHHPLDFEAMNHAAAILKEYRDFSSFSKLHTDVMTNNCVVTRAEWLQQGDEWVFHIEADRFLRNMVRSIVGTLFDVGAGKMNMEQFRAVIEAENRCKAGVSVAAHGLYLVDIRYPEDIFIIH